MRKTAALLGLLPSLLAITPIQAADLRPWYPRFAEIQPQATYLYQNYQTVQSPDGDFHYSSNDSFLTLSAGIPYYQWYGEFDVVLANTRHRTFGLDNLNLTARYQIWDDVAGVDQYSLVGGLTVFTAVKRAVRDISSFHHGQIEAEAHLAIGKETSDNCERFWNSRWWGIVAVGIADIGSPWLRLNYQWEKNFFDIYQWGVFANTLWGFGGDNLSHHHFRGYGPIGHRSVDVGLFATYNFEWGGILTASYAFRAYARNFPANTNLLSISFLYPFGL